MVQRSTINYWYFTCSLKCGVCFLCLIMQAVYHLWTGTCVRTLPYFFQCVIKNLHIKITCKFFFKKLQPIHIGTTFQQKTVHIYSLKSNFAILETHCKFKMVRLNAPNSEEWTLIYLFLLIFKVCFVYTGRFQWYTSWEILDTATFWSEIPKNNHNHTDMNPMTVRSHKMKC